MSLPHSKTFLSITVQKSSRVKPSFKRAFMCLIVSLLLLLYLVPSLEFSRFIICSVHCSTYKLYDDLFDGSVGVLS